MSIDRWRYAIEGSGDGVWDWDAVSGKVYYSLQWKAMLGFAAEEIGDDLTEWESRVHPEDLPWVREELRLCFSGQTPQYVSEQRLRCKTGEYKWVLDRGRIVFRTEDGSPLRIVGTLTDIDALKKTQQALRESEERFHLLFMKSCAVEMLVDPEAGKIVEANPAAAKFYGYAPEQMKTMSVADLNTLPMTEIKKCIQEALMEHKKVFRFQHRVADGSLRQVDVFPNTVVYGGTTLLRTIIQDVTGQAELEAEAKQLSQNFTTFFNTVDAFLFVLDADGRITKINETVLRRLGYEECELLGQHVLMVHPPERRGEAGENAKQMLAGNLDCCEVPLVTKAGRHILVETRITQGMWDGKPALFGVSKDITARKQAEKALLEKTALLQGITDNMFDMVSLTDLQGNYIFVGKSHSALGYDLDSLLGRNVLEFIHPEDLPSIQARFQEIVAGRRDNQRSEYRLRNADGSYLWIETAGKIMKDEAGNNKEVLFSSRDVTERKRMEEELKRLAGIDFLTGVCNRRIFLQRAEEELQRANRHGRNCVLLMLDVDHFKRTNDKYGHAAGDATLQKIAALCREVLRGADILGRIGGEEFAVLLVETDLAASLQVAERLRQTIQDEDFGLEKGGSFRLSLSIGVAGYNSDGETLSNLLRRADIALYQAKNQGRNRVAVSETGM